MDEWNFLKERFHAVLLQGHPLCKDGGTMDGLSTGREQSTGDQG